MAAAEQERESQQDESQQEDESQRASSGGLGRRAALTAAGAAAATGAAAFAAQKMLSDRAKSASGPRTQNSNGDGKQGRLASAAAGGLDTARGALLPLAETAAGAAGSYLAQHAPDVVRERLVPRFIDAFNDARD